MRVLIVVAVAAIVALTTWPACYDPDVKDCVFTCGSSDTCPGDTTCQAGFCRTADFTGTCHSETDAGSGSSTCPARQSGCEIVGGSDGTQIDGNAFCIEECVGPANSAAANIACAAGWHIAVLDTPAKLAAASSALAGTDWIGLDRSAIDLPWTWARGSGSVSPSDPNWSPAPNGGAINLCAALDNGKWFSDTCTTKHAFICTNE